MSKPDYAAAIQYAIAKLDSELPSLLTYHSTWHTTDDVMPAAMLFAQMSGVPETGQRLLEVAAAYHDIGFVYTLDEHERRGAELAGEVLPRFGFNRSQIEQIQNIIMATRLPQSPTNLLEEIIADADLDLLGREDFFERNLALHTELANLGNAIKWETWYEGQLEFLQNHHYFTAAAAAVRDQGKAAHIETMIHKLQALRQAS